MKAIARFLPLLLAAQAAAQEGLRSPEPDVAEAWDNHPALRARALERDAALEKARGTGFPPDPELTVGLFPRPMERLMGDQVLTVTLMQMLPWFGTLRNARDEAAAMAEMKAEELRETRLRIAFEVRENRVVLRRVAEELRAARESLRILQALENIARIRLAAGGDAGVSASGAMGGRAGSASPGAASGEMGMGGMSAADPAGSGSGTPGPMTEPGSGGRMPEGPMDGTAAGGLEDVLRVQMEAAELGERVAALEEELRILVLRRNRLLGRPAEQPLAPADTAGIPAPVALDVPPDAERALAEAPMLRMLEAEERAYGFQEAMSRAMGWPMVGLGVQYERLRPADRPYAHGGNMFMPMVSVSLPVWRGKYAGAAREAGRLRAAAAEARADAAQDFRLRFAEAQRERGDAERRVGLYTAQAERAQAILNIVTARYAAGGGDITEVLRLRQSLLEYRLQRARAVAEHNTAAARLERLAGGAS